MTNWSSGPVKLSPANARIQWTTKDGYLTDAAHAFIDGAFKRLGGYSDGVYSAGFASFTNHAQLQEVANRGEDAERLALLALMETMARRDAQFTQQISELALTVANLQQQTVQFQQQIQASEETQRQQAFASQLMSLTNSISGGRLVP